MELINSHGETIHLDSRYDINKIKSLLSDNNHKGLDSYLESIAPFPTHSEGGVDIKFEGGDLTTEDYREYGKKHQNPRRLQEIQEQYKDRTRDWYIENIVHPSQRPDKRFNNVARNERIDRAYSKYMRNLYGEELFKRAGLQGGSYEENLMQANSFTPEELEYMQNIRGFSPYMSAMNKNRSIRVRENPNDPTMYYLHAQQNNKEQ